MATVIDWRQTPNPQMVAEYACRVLCSGGTVAFPTEAGYHLAASGKAPAAVRRVVESLPSREEPLVVAVRGVGDARDWVPEMSALGQRLARRLWPGPLTLRFPPGSVEGQLGRAEAEVRSCLAPRGALRLRAPQHAAIQQVQQICPEPLLLAPLPPDPGAAQQAAAPAGYRTAARVPPVLDQMDLVILDPATPPSARATVVEVEAGGWRVLEPGVVEEAALQRYLACMIVFLCTGNTCRSPLAEGLFKKRLAEALGTTVEGLPQQGFFVLSAGLAATMGAGAAAEAIQTARGYGVDLGGHRSRPLTPDLAGQADHLIAMTHGHLQALQDHFPGLTIRPRLLRPDGEDLPDPIGQSEQVYEECARIIWECLDDLLARVVPGNHPS